MIDNLVVINPQKPPTFQEVQAMRLEHANQPTEDEETDEQLIQRLLREAEADAACNLSPVKMQHRPSQELGDDGTMKQRCGGGCRRVKKRIGGS